jgi:hypothetical protein
MPEPIGDLAQTGGELEARHQSQRGLDTMSERRGVLIPACPIGALSGEAHETEKKIVG